MNLKGRDGSLFRIELGHHSPDPRIALRNDTGLKESEIDSILKKLERMDRLNKNGPWIQEVLKAIADNPEMRARDLAASMGFEKDWYQGADSNSEKVKCRSHFIFKKINDHRRRSL